MIVNDIQELLRLTDSLLGKAPREIQAAVNYSTPSRKMIYYQFLTDLPGNILAYRSTFRHVYYGGADLNNNTVGLDEDWILHGHSMHEDCAAPFFCHQFTYWPKVTDNPAFVKAFTQKWNGVYKK